jgi:uncharacterized coiled-coil protein SlyX
MDRSMIEARLASLADEFASGQRMLSEYEAKIAAVREQLLRINGAMRVLSELLEEDGGAASPATDGPNAQTP